MSSEPLHGVGVPTAKGVERRPGVLAVELLHGWPGLALTGRPRPPTLHP